MKILDNPPINEDLKHLYISHLFEAFVSGQTYLFRCTKVIMNTASGYVVASERNSMIGFNLMVNSDELRKDFGIFTEAELSNGDKLIDNFPEYFI